MCSAGNVEDGVPSYHPDLLTVRTILYTLLSMRNTAFCCFLTLLVCSVELLGQVTPAPVPASSVDRPLSGFRFALIRAPEYADGSGDYMNLKPYVERRLADRGWAILRSGSDRRIESDITAVSSLVHCGIGHSYSARPGTSNSVTLTCADALGREVFSFTGSSGSGFTVKGDLEGAIRQIVSTIYDLRPRYVRANTVDLNDTLPRVETVVISEAEVDDQLSRGELAGPIEGIWGDGDYRIAIIPQGRPSEFVAVILEDNRALPAWYQPWRVGMIKARLTQSASGQTFLVRWADGNRAPFRGVATLEAGVLKVTSRSVDYREPLVFLKIRPAMTADTDRPTPISESLPVASSIGTGFLIGPDLIATNYHVIRDMGTIEFSLPGDIQSIGVEVVVADPINDLAILRFTQQELLVTADPLELSGAEPRLGEDAIVIGFPLGSLLGTSHKVTTGVVSSLDGIGGDPRVIQVTAPIQPGSSGSPIFNSAGKVIGVITSTLDSAEAVRATGQVPQNVNFAIRAAYLLTIARK